MSEKRVFRVFRMFLICGFSFFRYLWCAGLTRESGMIILSSHEGANWGRRDIGNARMLINLRRLDLIRHLEMFVSSLVRLLPPETTFVGCFAQRGLDAAGTQASGSHGGFWNGLSGHGGGTCQMLSRARVSALLEGSGLEVIDMREMNGLTYFHSRKMSRSLVANI
jgi:hypothetical protein